MEADDGGILAGMETIHHPILTTPRLLLRPYRETDLAAAHAYGAIPEVSQYMDWGPNTEEDTSIFLKRCVAASKDPEEKGHFFAITLREGGRMIGGCDLGAVRQGQGASDMGYCLHPDFWGQGYATEAANVVLGLAFNALGLHRVTATCDPDNVGSWRVMEKIGMRREGHEQEAALFKGCWHDTLRYAVLGREWQAAGWESDQAAHH